MRVQALALSTALLTASILTSMSKPKNTARNKPILRFKATPAETTRTQIPSHAEARAAVNKTIPD